MTAITTNLKTQVQAQIDAADSSTSLKDLLVIRKSAEGLKCNESNLDTLMSAAIASMGPSTALKDLLLGNKASGLPDPISVPIGGSTPLLASFPSMVSIGGASYLKSGYYLTSGFDESLIPYMSGGRVWDLQPTNAIGASPIYCLENANGIFVMGGSNRKISTSPDGVTWTAATVPAGAGIIYTVAYHNNLWLAGTTTGELLASTDNGATWVIRSLPIFSSGSIGRIIYANGLWVVVGRGGKVATSPDGVTWTERASGVTTASINDVIYGNGRFVFCTDQGFYSSVDGITWTQLYASAGTGFSSIAFNGETFVATGHSGAVLSSVNGVYWAVITTDMPLTGLIRVIWNKKDLFIFAGSSSTMSIVTCDADLKNFKVRSMSSDAKGVATDGNICVAGGANGIYKTSQAVLCLESSNRNDFLRIL